MGLETGGSIQSPCRHLLQFPDAQFWSKSGPSFCPDSSSEEVTYLVIVTVNTACVPQWFWFFPSPTPASCSEMKAQVQSKGLLWLREGWERGNPPSAPPAPGLGILASTLSLMLKMWNCGESFANTLISTGTEASLLESCEVLEYCCLSTTHPSAACTETQKGWTHKFT